MSASEFSIIAQYFSGIGSKRKDVVLGVGDDCALMSLPERRELVVSTDTLVEGVHFLPDMPPLQLGHKVVAVNLSDLAAMGAEPAWLTLALTLREVNTPWLEAFAQGVSEACEYFRVQLVGGDTTRGPCSVSITAMGLVQTGKALRRDSAKPGDWLYVTGNLGDAALGLDLILGNADAAPDSREFLINRHYRPTPRVVAGQSLKGLANAAIDISDGLASDLRHILKASNCDAQVELESLPISDAMRATVGREQAWQYALAGGEDYELCFTVPEQNRGSLETALVHSGVKHTCIGQLRAGSGNVEYLLHGDAHPITVHGYEHFGADDAGEQGPEGEQNA